jgi:hypothetical protein
LKIAALEGDDVGDLIGPDTPLPDSGMTVGEVGRPPGRGPRRAPSWPARLSGSACSACTAATPRCASI